MGVGGWETRNKRVGCAHTSSEQVRRAEREGKREGGRRERRYGGGEGARGRERKRRG